VTGKPAISVATCQAITQFSPSPLAGLGRPFAMTGIRSNILAMSGYVPGEQINDPDVIKLNTNENPYPPSPRVFEAIRELLTSNKLRKYPQPLGDTFRNTAGRVLGVDPDSILIGNGSDDLLTILTRAFVPEGGCIVFPAPSYVLYRSLAEIQGASYETIRFAGNWQSLSLPFPELGANLAFLPNPNSPSGTMVPHAVIARLASVADVLVLDEAYADFADWNGLELRAHVPNLIITRSFSKAYSLAGMRFGYAIAPPPIVRELIKVKDSYNCDVLSLAAASAAIEDQDYFKEVRARIHATRERMAVELPKLGFIVTPSQANFLWCRRTDRPVKPIYEALKQRKLLVRYVSYPNGPTGVPEGTYDGLRISVGTDEEIDQLLKNLGEIL
jgi:histidinol-phosphate aminotransferase